MLANFPILLHVTAGLPQKPNRCAINRFAQASADKPAAVEDYLGRGRTLVNYIHIGFILPGQPCNLCCMIALLRKAVGFELQSRAACGFLWFRQVGTYAFPLRTSGVHIERTINAETAAFAACKCSVLSRFLQVASRSFAMTVEKRLCSLLSFLILGALPALAQEQLPAISIPSQGMILDVVVDTKSGQPVANLTQQNFTILDNKSSRSITSFKMMSAASEPVQVILLIDAVNTPYQMTAWVRQNTEKFLKGNGGKLTYPTALAVLSDQGAEIQNSFSTDGNALSDELDHYQIGLREINRDSEWGANERLQICLKAIQELVAFAATLPGRKIVLWISPGWPLLSGPQVQLDSKQEQQIFDQIVFFSTRMRQIEMTLYNINPVGVAESLGRADYFESFLKGVATPNDVQLGDLGVQVLSVQSGGLALESNSDVEGLIQKCLIEAQSWYEITFDPPPADKPDEYHRIEIRLDQRGLIARSRDGYYANPTLPPLP